MTKLKTLTLAAAREAVATTRTELDIVRAEIVRREATSSVLALRDDDGEFETNVLEIERAKRRETRAVARHEAAVAALAEANAIDEQARRQTVYSDGLEAVAESERLVEEYAEHAARIVEILRRLHVLHGPVRAANRDLPDDAPSLPFHGERLINSIELPATAGGGKSFWWTANRWRPSPIDEAPPRFVPIVLDVPTPAARAVPDPKAPRHISLPPSDWTPRG